MVAPSRGFTLLEMLVATAVAGVAMAAAFSFATFQVSGFAEQQDVAQLASASRIVEDAIGEDIRSAGFGTSFWAGTGHLAAFENRGVVADAGGAPLGVPAVRIVDNAVGPVGGLGTGVRIGSDAIAILRVEGQSTTIPSSGPGATGITTAPGGAAYTVADLSVLAPCGTGNGSRLVLISDMVRSSQPASMLLQIANIVPPAAPGPGTITFVNNTYGLNPGNAGTPLGVLPAPRQFGPGSLVTCVRLVTYWVDNIGRLRMFMSQVGDPGGTTSIQAAAAIGGIVPSVPIDPVGDRVLADGVMDLQLALFMSGMSPVAPQGWVHDAANVTLADYRQIAEVRAIRISATLSTPRAADSPISRPPVAVENRILDPAVFPPTYVYRTYVVTADLRNMRIFDLMSSNAINWDDIRSYPE